MNIGSGQNSHVMIFCSDGQEERGQQVDLGIDQTEGRGGLELGTLTNTEEKDGEALRAQYGGIGEGGDQESVKRSLSQSG